MCFHFPRPRRANNFIGCISIDYWVPILLLCIFLMPVALSLQEIYNLCLFPEKSKASPAGSVGAAVEVGTDIVVVADAGEGSEATQCVYR